jgi:hypothetical protein
VAPHLLKRLEPSEPEDAALWDDSGIDDYREDGENEEE